MLIKSSWEKCFRELLHQFKRKLNTVDKTVVTDSIGQVALIGLNKPHTRNAIDIPTAQALKVAFQDFESNDNLLAGVLYGVGGNFCSGFDYYEINQTPTTDLKDWLIENKSCLGITRKLLNKPVVAAVNGYAVGAGFELALWCDLRVVEETALMGRCANRFGSPMVDGGSYRLSKLIGLSRSLDIVLTGRLVMAKEALDIGLANRLVACGTSLGQAVNLANSLVKFPQGCSRVDRGNLYSATFETTDAQEMMEKELEGVLGLLDKEVKEGAARFVSGVGRHGKFHLDNFHQNKKFSV